MIVHACVDIRGALKLSRRQKAAMFRDKSGRRLTADEAHDALCEHLRKGHLVLPLGKPCDGFSYVTGCPGHPAATAEANEASP
jgi:hypothetical protein